MQEWHSQQYKKIDISKDKDVISTIRDHPHINMLKDIYKPFIYIN